MRTSTLDGEDRNLIDASFARIALLNLEFARLEAHARPPAPLLADPPVPNDVARCRWRRWLARDLAVLEILQGAG